MAIHIALAKGRIHKVVMKYLAESGYDFPTYSEESRKLIFEDAKGQLKVTLVKSPDVAVYVERGAADVGIVGKDVLIEEAPGADVYEVMDLGIGRCRMAVAGIAGKKVDMTKRITIGTKYPRIARAYFEANHHSGDIIKLNGSVELAPIVGLSDVIVDIVETGTTLRENHLAVVETIVPISARLIANKTSFKFKNEAIESIVKKLSVSGENNP